MNNLKHFSFIVFYILGFLIIGGVSLIQGGVGFTELTTPWLIDNILTIIAIIFIIIGTLLRAIDIFKTTNDEYKESDKTIVEFAKESYVPSVFSRYSDYTNKKRKLKQHIANTHRAIAKLEAKASDIDLHIWNNGKEEEKKKNKFCIKRSVLETKISDSWLRKNIDTASVKYDKINSDIVLGGYYSRDADRYVNDFITKNKGLKITKERLPILLIGFGMTALVSSIVVTISFNFSVLLIVFTKSLVLLWQIFMTLRYADGWNHAVTLKDIRFRKGVVKEYNIWVVQELERQTQEETTKKNNKTIVEQFEQELFKEGLQKANSTVHTLAQRITAENIITTDDSILEV